MSCFKSLPGLARSNGLKLLLGKVILSEYQKRNKNSNQSFLPNSFILFKMSYFTISTCLQLTTSSTVLLFFLLNMLGKLLAFLRFKCKCDPRWLHSYILLRAIFEVERQSRGQKAWNSQLLSMNFILFYHLHQC